MFKKITVIGSGVMGSAIAAHITNAGCKVNLLDIPDKNHKNKNNIAVSYTHLTLPTTPYV